MERSLIVESRYARNYIPKFQAEFGVADEEPNGPFRFIIAILAVSPVHQRNGCPLDTAAVFWTQVPPTIVGTRVTDAF